MAQDRYYHPATQLTDGRVLVVAGWGRIAGYLGTVERWEPATGYGSLASTELYDPITGVFTPGRGMSIPRHSHTATLLPDGRVLLVGGSNGPEKLASAEFFP